VRLAKGDRRDEHQPLREPAARIRDDIADCPQLVVKQEVLDCSDFIIGCQEPIADNLFHTLRMSLSVSDSKTGSLILFAGATVYKETTCPGCSVLLVP
jgi:hypothetical protein